MSNNLSKKEEEQVAELFYQKGKNQKDIARLTKMNEEIDKQLAQFKVVRKNEGFSQKTNKNTRPKSFSMKHAVEKLFEKRSKTDHFASAEILDALNEDYPEYEITGTEVNSALNYQKTLGVIENVRKGVFRFTNTNNEEIITVEDIPF